ncbi:hypothetical protein IVA95_31450 [Bradyrhizobium sp. 157]|uniref:hypothetical protein n=1 Tax=Bradyrhizobium sp. 157 TaxID=2782631 RepID=UPI001FF7C762|nr:hypothetical protein [Bradyrhizobium sp. 157]MCK1641944.1 hypothetical protein [Bradyrhizobium sp. 157]
MATFKEKHDAAGARYAAAVAELRAAYGELAALHRKASMPGFGYPPEIVPLRHTRFAPDVSGSFADDVRAALDNMQSSAA